MLYILSILGLLVIMTYGSCKESENVRYVYSSCNCDTVYIHDTVILKKDDNITIDSLIQRFGFPQRRMLNWTIDTLYY
jgi:hypothetical protein